MPRKTRHLLVALLVSTFAVVAGACANPTAPSAECTGGQVSSTC